MHNSSYLVTFNTYAHETEQGYQSDQPYSWSLYSQTCSLPLLAKMKQFLKWVKQN